MLRQIQPAPRSGQPDTGYHVRCRCRSISSSVSALMWSWVPWVKPLQLLGYKILIPAPLLHNPSTTFPPSLALHLTGWPCLLKRACPSTRLSGDWSSPFVRPPSYHPRRRNYVHSGGRSLPLPGPFFLLRFVPLFLSVFCCSKIYLA